MAQHAVTFKGVSIRQACQIFTISECNYCYKLVLRSENLRISNWLNRITDSQKNWGFGLCYLYLRNVRGFR